MLAGGTNVNEGYIVYFTGALANRNLPPLVPTPTSPVGQQPTFTVRAAQDGGVFTGKTVSLENALDAVRPGKPANVIFAVSGQPGNYVVNFLEQSNEVQLLQNLGLVNGSITLSLPASPGLAGSTNPQNVTINPAALPTALQIQNALIALDNVGPGDVLVTGPAGGPYTITFQGALGNRPLSTLQVINGGPNYQAVQLIDGRAKTGQQPLTIITAGDT